MSNLEKTAAWKRYYLLLGWLQGVYHQQRALEYVTKRKSFATKIVRRAIDQLKRVSPDPQEDWSITVPGEPNVLRFLERGCADLGISYSLKLEKDDRLETMDIRTLPKFGEI